MTTATAQLNRRLLDLAQRGDRPRCSDPVHHTLWTSEDQHDREIAAAWCVGCNVLQLCGDAAVERDERWGVWASKDYSHRAGRKRTET
jgi:hypothetical protein